MKASRGFTLIEITIALIIFALLASITASAMYYAFNTREHISRQANQLNAIQLAISLIKRDTEQTTSRRTLGNEMHVFPPFVGQADYLEFTRDGLVNPEGLEQRSTLNRVAYVCTKTALIRRNWERVDTPFRERFQDRILLENLDKCAFAYLDQNKQVQSQWQESDEQVTQKKTNLPLAIQVTLSWQALGNMSLLFIIPEALYGH